MLSAGHPAPLAPRSAPARPAVLWGLLTLCSAALADDLPPGLQRSALAAPSRGAGSTLFTPLDSAATGLVTENAYADPRMWGELHQEFKFGAIGTGVTIGDYDNDGRPDLFVVNKTGGSRLFRNLGHWRFEDTTAPAGLAPRASWWDDGVARVRAWIGSSSEAAGTAPWEQGATFADINNDGHLDLYVCRFGAPNLLYVNQGDGTFREEAAARGLALEDASSMAAFADYDRDGWLDVFVQTNLLNVATSPTGQPDRLLRNRGDGTFVDVTTAAGIAGLTQGHSATWWDYNHDGWPDLYGAHDFAPPDTLYRNSGDGRFQNRLNDVIPHTPHSAMGADLGDVNNDGLIDLLVADMAATTPFKDQRGMAKIRALLRDTAGTDAEPTPQVMRNALYLATGGERVLEAAHLAGLEATDWTWSVLLHDFDNDGRIDVHVTNGMVRELHNADLVQRQSGSEGLAEGTRLLKASPALAEANLAFRNRGDLRFEAVGPAWGLDQRGVSFGAAAGDLDQDGDLDLVFSNYEAGLTVLRNDSPGGHRVTFALRGQRSNRFGVGATVRIETPAGIQVRQHVVARGYLSSGEPILHFGLGDEALIPRVTVHWPSGHQQSFTNLSADHHYTVTEPNGPPPAGLTPPPHPAPPPLFADAGDDAGFRVPAANPWFDELSAQPLLPFRQDRLGPSLTLADVTGDGRPDAIVGGLAGAPARLLLATGQGFAAPVELPGSGGGTLHHGPVAAFDVDADNDIDLLLTRTGTREPPGSDAYQPRLLINDGQGNFSPAPADALPALPSSIGAAAVADYNRDGRPDVFLGGRSRPGAYPQAEPSALWENRNGRLVHVTATLAPELRTSGIVASALWTDLDDDGWLDLLLAPEWGSLAAWKNRGNQPWENISTPAGFAAAGSGWWSSLVPGDFNGDGRIDYLAGNAGLNTPYRASPDAPAVLFRGDFASRGRIDLIEALSYDGRLYPRRSRNELATAVPTLMRRFPRHDLYARTPLDDLVGAPTLAAAERSAVTELRSGVWLSQADGTFAFSPLPHPAQIAPVQGAAVADVNADGNLDLVVAHNSSAPIAAIGRWDGGLGQVLLGDGRGGFTVLPPQASGVVIPGDAEALLLADGNADGAPELLVTRHGAESLAFTPRNAPPGHALRVDLKGPAATTAGARVTLELANGAQQTLELALGHGRLSQGSSSLFFGYSAGSTPRQLVVRWPDGSLQRHSVPAESRVISLAPAPATVSSP